MFGFSEDFIQWVKLFNTNIKAYILQCGFLSEEILIERRCRQGDPLSAYLFLLGAEVLSTLIKLDPNIKGLKFGDQHIKMTQFADDATLILDGTQCSLEVALNILEIFGNYSGLKMKTEKTKVIWIGRKRFSKEKLDIAYHL